MLRSVGAIHEHQRALPTRRGEMHYRCPPAWITTRGDQQQDGIATSSRRLGALERDAGGGAVRGVMDTSREPLRDSRVAGRSGENHALEPLPFAVEEIRALDRRELSLPRAGHGRG